MRLLDLTAKIISKIDTVYNIPKKISEECEYVKKFKAYKETNTKYNSLKVYFNYQVKSIIPFKEVLYKKMLLSSLP